MEVLSEKELVSIGNEAKRITKAILKSLRECTVGRSKNITTHPLYPVIFKIVADNEIAVKSE